MLRKLIPGVLVLLFTYTGSSKLFALETFKGALYNQPFPHWLAAPLIFLIPAIEILTAICLLFERTSTIGLYSALSLLILFTLYIAAILLHVFSKTPCSCGGIFRGLSWLQHLWVNLFFLALTALQFFTRTKTTISSPSNSLL